MKKKTYIKEGAFQKVSNNKGTTIKGALDLNKEVLDLFVDKDLLATDNCCQYFPTFPEVPNTEEGYASIPVLGIAWINDGSDNYCLVTKLPDGNVVFSCFGPA